MNGPAKQFMCEPTADLKFITYIIRDVDANFILFRFDNDGNVFIIDSIGFREIRNYESLIYPRLLLNKIIGYHKDI